MRLSVLAIDPGPEKSAWVQLRDGFPVGFGHEGNGYVRRVIEEAQIWADDVAIEMIASYGMPVGAEVFETCVWIGRFSETARRCNIADKRVHYFTRLQVKTHHCHSAKANDATVRQAIIDRFGGRDRAVGLKANPGPLYYIKNDMWAALAVALLWHDAVPREGT